MLRIPHRRRHSLHLIRINGRRFDGWDQGHRLHDRDRAVSTAAASPPSSSAEVPPEANAPVSAEPVYFSPVLAGFEWSAEWDLGNSVMDETHREFVELLDALIRASDDGFLARLDRLPAAGRRGTARRRCAGSACGSGGSHDDSHACGSGGHACGSDRHACGSGEKAGCGSGCDGD